MKKILIAFSLLFLLAAKSQALPDEGMWLPMFVQRLNYVDMQKMGLHLTAEELYSINHSSLKDAVVSLGGFCTAEVVSPEGLLFTNHHCGYDAIQKHSSVDHDYLTDGFWAMNHSEELPNEGLTVSFLVRMDEVTSDVLGALNANMTEGERSKAVGQKVAELKKDAAENGKYEVEVKAFFNGNEYYRFVYQVYKDIRLVGAPPSSIGKFGGDTDNWMWPRHTGDFSIFRIYTAPDGSPATYSKDNVPFHANKFLPISLKGYQKNDFAMIWGFPGTTDRYRTSYATESTLNDMNPAIINGLGAVLEKQKEGMDADNAVRIAYASDYAGLANFWKNKVGETRDLKRLDVISKKQAIEEQLKSWINADDGRKAKYGNIFDELSDIYSQYKQSDYIKLIWYNRIPMFGSKPIGLASQVADDMKTAFASDKKGKDLAKELEQDQAKADETFKDYNENVERNVLKALLAVYRDKVPAAKQADIFNVIRSKYNNDISAYVDKMFDRSVLSNQEKFSAFLAKPSKKTFEKDPLLALYNSLSQNAMALQQSAQPLSDRTKAANRAFVAALREMETDKKFYPDANSTLRMSYGKVLDYYPADAVHYNYYTTLDGVMAKEDPKNDEFIVPAKLKALYEAKDYGQYGESGKMFTCFLTDNDITGGNSGSPVLNGDGQLIGIAFDGNWEAMSGNILFEPELQRTINVDIRYVLFVIDKYAGASNLIRELTLVK